MIMGVWSVLSVVAGALVALVAGWAVGVVRTDRDAWSPRRMGRTVRWRSAVVRLRARVRWTAVVCRWWRVYSAARLWLILRWLGVRHSAFGHWVGRRWYALGFGGGVPRGGFYPSGRLEELLARIPVPGTVPATWWFDVPGHGRVAVASVRPV